MKKFYFLITLVIIFSCSTEEIESETSEISEVQMKASVSQDSIIPLNPDDFPDVEPQTENLVAQSSFSHLYELDGIEFYLQSKNSYFGNNTLQTTGKGQEVVLTSHSTSNDAQLFYLEFLPASSGIPYLIHSYKEDSPIGAGSYSSDPDTYVLYTQPSGSSNLFGFSWDFYLNSDKDGYIIENQDIIGSGSGGPWDIFYYALESRNGNINFVETNNSSIYQQFNIVPNDEFTVESVTLNYNDAEITSTNPYLLKDGTVVNNTSNNMQQTLTFSETESESTSFKETNGITTTKTGSVNLGVSLFSVIEIGGSYDIQQGTQETVEYSSSSTRSITVTEAFNIVVPPQTSVTYKFLATRHKANVPYTTELKGVNTNKIMNVTGIYSGVDYSSTYLEVTETPMSGNTVNSATNTYIVYPESSLDEVDS